MRVALAGWIGSTNIGDELLVATATRELQQRGASVVAISARPAATRRDHRIEAVSAFRPDEMWRTLGAVDALVLIAGTMQDVTSPFNLPLHTLPLRMAARRGVRMVGAGIGVDVHAAVGKHLVRNALAPFAEITVRDSASADGLAALGLPRPVVAADLALATPAPDGARRDRIGVALRTWTGGGVVPAALRWRRGLADDDIVAAVATALDTLARPVHFVALQKGRDDELHHRIATRLSVPITFATPTVDTVAAEIASCAALVTMRYHAAVLAAATATPLVTFDAFAKLRSLVADLNGSAVMVPWTPAGIAELPGCLPTDAPDVTLLRSRGVANVELFDRLVR
jgi:polysaccharide pyruvyl transferase WcaK-like protein